MIIKTSKFKGNEIYTAGSIAGAVYEKLEKMKIGSQFTIDAIERVDGKNASIPVIRQAISNAAKVLGYSFKTRKVIAGEGVEVWRVA